MTKVLEKLKSNINNFSEKRLENINPPYAPYQGDIINLIDLYWMSRFKNGDYDEHGQKKPFFNIIETPVLVAGKLIDLDTKDPKIIPTANAPIDYAIYFEKELGIWMRDSGLAKLFNSIKWMLPKYGSIVLKSFKDSNGERRLKFVPLQNLDMDARAESLEKSHFITERHEVLKRNLDKLPYDKKKINKVKDEMKGNCVTIYEYYGDLGNGTKFTVVADVGDGIVMEEDNMVNPPYYELHWDKVPGRWLGVGLVEKNFESQIHLNRIQYLKSNGLTWTSKHIYQTQDDNINRNLLVDIEDGQVIKTRRPIDPVVNEERNLSAYREEERVWTENMSRRSFMTETLLGQIPAAGTPLGTVSIATQQGSSFFENKREEFGQFIKDILWKDVIPEFKNKNKKEHWLNFTNASPDEIDKFDNRVLRERVFNKTLGFLNSNGYFPDARQIQLMESFERQKLSNASERWVKLPDSFYENIKFKIDIVITGESQNLQAKLNALQIALQTAKTPSEQNQIRNKLLQLVGEEPIQREISQRPEDIMSAQLSRSGGSQPRTRMPNQTPGRAITETRI